MRPYALHRVVVFHLPDTVVDRLYPAASAIFAGVHRSSERSLGQKVADRWKSVETRSLLHTAAKLKRLSLGMRLLSLLPDPAGRKPDKPWGGVCVLENCGPAPTA